MYRDCRFNNNNKKITKHSFIQLIYFMNPIFLLTRTTIFWPGFLYIYIKKKKFARWELISTINP